MTCRLRRFANRSKAASRTAVAHLLDFNASTTRLAWKLSTWGALFSSRASFRLPSTASARLNSYPPYPTLVVYSNAISGVEHFQPQGISGFGETTGTKHQATGVTSTSFKTSLQNGQANETFVNRFLIIGAGPGNNFLVRAAAHLTFNVSGTVTVLFDDFSVECK